MPTFTYQARDEAGRLVKGALEAETQTAVVDRLKKMGYLVTQMEEKTGGLSGFKELRFGRGVPAEDLLMAAIELANLVDAGIPLVGAVQTVASQTSQPQLKQALELVGREIEGGAPFAEVLSHQPQVFPKLMVSMMTAAQASGKMAEALNRFSKFQEKDLALTREVTGALTYPALLLLACVLLTLVVVTFVVPQFATLFGKVGIPLPLPTQIMSAVGQAIRTQWLGLSFLGIAVFFGLKKVVRIDRIRLRIDDTLLKLPVVGMVIHQTAVARLTRVLATLVASGVPILDSLNFVREVSGNQVIFKEIDRVRSSIEYGERMAETLSVGKVFHPDAIAMIRVGEETGRLDLMLDKVADFYELRTNFKLKQLTTLLEPLMLFVMGGMVALIMASLLLPMFDLVKVLQHGGIR